MSSVRAYCPFLSALVLWGLAVFANMPVNASAQSLAGTTAGGTVRGEVRDAQTGEALGGVVLQMDGGTLWAVSDEKGTFVLSNIPDGDYELELECLGYRTVKRKILLHNGRCLDADTRKPLPRLTVSLQAQSLALDEVVVTASLSKDNPNTTRTIGRTALDHLQISALDNVSALLPGGKTINPDLTATQAITLRSGGSSEGNVAFATAVEVNGVRMGDNASFGGLAGVDTRSIPVENIESVEVLTGVPSAEYGDLGSGLVRVITKKGRTPFQITMGVNPRTYDVSLSKGLQLGKGVLNLSAQWTRATQKLSSPYTAYTRRGFTAEYNFTPAKIVRIETGITGNIGGMDSRNDPDVFSDERTRVRDNLFTPHVKAVFLLNRAWVSNLTLEASAYFHDKRSHEHTYNSYASRLPAVHAESQGYFLAASLPTTFYADRVTDSKELDWSASLKYDWLAHWGPLKNTLKAGFSWKADGNVGRGEYYEDPSLSANGYRPRPYSDYPYMHNLALWVEDRLEVPVGASVLALTAGLRGESILLKGTVYNGLSALSPRLGLRWNFPLGFTLRGGWGITRKLPGFSILYPEQQYLDILSFGFSHASAADYVYYTRPYTLSANPGLKWQSNHNSELALDWEKDGWKLSLTGFYAKTLDPYSLSGAYTPFSYNIWRLPDNYTVPASPQIKVDRDTGQTFLRENADEAWTAMDILVGDRTFINTRMPVGGATIHRTGAELTADTPQIPLLRTRFRLDASYVHSWYMDRRETFYYNAGWSHPSDKNRSYPYVGIYEGPSSLAQGKKTHTLDANLTLITHIPEVRLVVTVRLEATFLRYSRNLSDRAYTVAEGSVNPTGGDIYGGNSYTAVAPLAWMDLDGVRHEWTAAQAANPDFQRLILRSGNIYTFAEDGYDPYFSANLSLTKEIGKHVSLSFYVNNFTFSRPYRQSYATGVSAIFTPAFYYGLTCRIKI